MTIKEKAHLFVAPEGYPFIAMALVLVVVGWLIHPVFAILFLGLLLFVIFFFRNPQRAIPSGEGFILSPADGKVIYSGPAMEGRFLKRSVHKVSIFMSPLNVHVNRVPVSGKIKQVSYNKGKFFPAFAEKASLDNEQNAVVIETSTGEEVLFIQIAGWLARRIACYARIGEELTHGSIYGLIRFGSRMDIYFPENYRFTVEVGQKVKGGETILAKRSVL